MEKPQGWEGQHAGPTALCRLIFFLNPICLAIQLFLEPSPSWPGSLCPGLVRSGDTFQLSSHPQWLCSSLSFPGSEFPLRLFVRSFNPSLRLLAL